MTNSDPSPSPEPSTDDRLKEEILMTNSDPPPPKPPPEPSNETRLKEEILEELRSRESLKKEILKELQPTGLKYSLAEFVRHPLFLIFFGFLLTGLGTTLVKAFWDRGEWNRQQQEQAQKHALEQKLELKDQVLDAVSGANAAVSDITSLLFYETSQSAASKESARLNYWQEASRTWNSSSQKLLPKIGAYFKDPATQKSFEDIIDKRHKIGVAVNNAINAARKDWTILDRPDSQEYKNLIKYVRDNILVPTKREVSDPTKQLLDLMQVEIQKEIQASKQN